MKVHSQVWIAMVTTVLLAIGTLTSVKFWDRYFK
jgi:hypothetical protein